MNVVTTIDIDLAKNSFAIYGVNSEGKMVLRRTLPGSCQGTKSVYLETVP